jgi:hypothetical protein
MSWWAILANLIRRTLWITPIPPSGLPSMELSSIPHPILFHYFTDYFFNQQIIKGVTDPLDGVSPHFSQNM